VSRGPDPGDEVEEPTQIPVDPDLIDTDIRERRP
jgi:hypothetical protein